MARRFFRGPTERAAALRWLAAALAAVAAAAYACEPALDGAVRRVEGKIYVLAWRPQPAPIRQSAFFGIEAVACARQGPAPVALRIDAQMPEHRHGMNYRPRVVTVAAGQFLVDGLLLHMPGHWAFQFELRGDAGRETLRDSIWLQ